MKVASGFLSVFAVVLGFYCQYAASEFTEAKFKKADDLLKAAGQAKKSLSELVKQNYALVIASCLKENRKFGGKTPFQFVCDADGKGTLEKCVKIGTATDPRPDREEVWRYFNEEGIRKCKLDASSNVPSLCYLSEEMRQNDKAMILWEDPEGQAQYYFACRNWNAINQGSEKMRGCTPRPYQGQVSTRAMKTDCSV